MRAEERVLDEIIKAKQDIRKLQQDIHDNSQKYSSNMCEYFQQLETEARFRYILDSTPIKLFHDYKKNIKHIVEMIYNPKFSKKQNVLNVLEYARVMVMYENVKRKYTADRQIMDLSRYPIFLSVYGKGFCYSQARFTRDILLEMGFRAADFYIDVYKSTNNQEEGIPHQQTLVELDNDCYFIDSTDYYGSLDGVQFKVQPENQEKLKSVGVRTDFSATQEEIRKSRNYVLSKLVKELEIDKISRQLKLDEKGDLEKQCVIMAFVESRLNLTKNLETHMASANLNGVNIEVGKLIELFLFQNNIEYDIECKRENRKDTIYKTKIGQNEISVCPTLLFSNDINQPGILMKGTHFLERENKHILISSINEKMAKTYLNYINQGRVDVLKSVVNNICVINDMYLDDFIQAPMENMRKYAPEINVNANAMRTLVRNVQNELQQARSARFTARSIMQGVTKVGTKSGMNNILIETFKTAKQEDQEININEFGYRGE